MPISISDTIDIRYRLQPQDLGGQPRPVLVRNVTLEGVEMLTPLVHFEGLARPLALDLEQRMQIADIAHSNLLVDWIGLPLILRPERQGAFETIRLAPAQGRRARPLPLSSTGWARKPANRRRIMRVLLMTFLLAAAFAAVTYIETLGGLDQLPSLFSR
jgi:hypothetical protein